MYVIYAIMAQTTGKEKIRFFIVPPSGGTPVFTYVEEADNNTNKNRALIEKLVQGINASRLKF